MACLPLTHHEILEWVRPFARCGRHVDLAASNRLERRLSFRPVDVNLDGQGARDTLMLEQFDTGTYQLTRVLSQPGGLVATLTAMGAEPAELLARVSAVEPAAQTECGPGFRIARSYKLPPDGGSGSGGGGGAGARAPPLIFTRGVAEIDDLLLTFTLPSTVGVAAEITLEPKTGVCLAELPDDLLAVLGWDWVRLIRTREGWKSKLRLRGDKRKRSRGAERALLKAAVHVSRTLAEPPGHFHERWAAARWAVVFRRSIPALMLLLLAAIIAVLPRFQFEHHRPVVLLLFDVPTALIALSLCLQEMPQYEIPPLPRRSAAARWRKPLGPGAALE
jgi:hypothetical protein